MICTLTGVDDYTPIGELFQLAKIYPFVEWGVLYSETEVGQGRYPSMEYIGELCNRIAKQDPLESTRPRFAMHVCGRAVKKLMRGELPFVQHFDRIQVNFNSRQYTEGEKRALFTYLPGKTIITQHNENNTELVDLFASHANHAILFDASGGRGLTPDAWPARIANIACGYAGGLSLDNLHEELPRIAAACGGRPDWIDMESSLRNARDMFDLGRAVLSLEIVDTSGFS